MHHELYGLIERLRATRQTVAEADWDALQTTLTAVDRDLRAWLAEQDNAVLAAEAEALRQLQDEHAAVLALLKERQTAVGQALKQLRVGRNAAAAYKQFR